MCYVETLLYLLGELRKKQGTWGERERSLVQDVEFHSSRRFPSRSYNKMEESERGTM